MSAIQSAPSSSAKALLPYQVRVFWLTWLSYACYYLTRKNFAYAKTTLETQLGVDTDVLGAIDTVYLGLYALGQFLNGALGDRFGARKMIGFGMIATGLSSVIFASGNNGWVFGFAFGINGLCQSTGWPNNVKAMAPWFTRKQRGAVMGAWCTNYQAGGLVSTVLATWLVSRYVWPNGNDAWENAFLVPAVIVSGVALLILFFLVETPQQVGLEPVEEPTEEAESQRKAPFRTMIRIPALWCLGGAYFGLKLIRYTLLFWLPYYLETVLGYSKEQAGYFSTPFEVGGIIGTIIIGWLTDRYFTRNRSRLTVPVLIGLAGALLLYQVVGPSGKVANALSLALVGFLLFGPDALISGAAAQDVGGPGATGSAAGIINGLGSIGGMLSGIITPFYKKAEAWDALFYTFVGLSVLSAVALLPLALKKPEPEPSAAGDTSRQGAKPPG